MKAFTVTIGMNLDGTPITHTVWLVELSKFNK